MKYTVYIKETLGMVVDCEADNMYDAIQTIKKGYKNEEYVLDSTNFVDVEFEIIE